MGNTSTRESRAGDGSHRSHHPGHSQNAEAGASLQPERSSGRRNRVSRGDLGGILGISPAGGSGSNTDAPYERRETKQEREARRLERERVARLAERERSMREEHVDGGFLVTLGTYTGPEDFNKQIVRQLQIERKIAPFWRGLNDVDDQWTEPQIIAAARGLPIPAADQTPPDELIPRPLSSSDSPSTSTQNLNNLTVPMGGRTLSATSEQSQSNPGSALGSPVSANPPRASSPFKPRGKALAAVLGATSRNGSTTEIMPREINLPNDPFVNGQPLEVFLYKDATECPICFLSYPPYLNHTRCCDQAICSECFVQIKRPDPHFPEGHNENDPNHNPEEAAGLLVSEPACCPYCTQPDFGVTYEPPPFRRGLAYSVNPSTIGSMNTAMSSSSSLNSGNLSPSVTTPTAGRRRNQSLSVHAPNVVSTDKIRPEWASKLQAARAHQARRAAAATALHTAAFLMGNNESRAFRSRFSRRNTGGSGSTSTGGAPPGLTVADSGNGNSGPVTPSQTNPDLSARGSLGQVGVSFGGTNRRSRIEELEDMMMAEAVRLSLASEEERKRKAEKEERKESKKREKEEKKAAKAAAKHGSPYEGGADNRSGHTSASGSSLSLPGLGFGRKRGNSGASNLRVEASVASATVNAGTSAAADPSLKDKGKSVDRGLPTTPDAAESSATAPVSGARPIPSPHPTAGPSHLRQMSSASSISSSILDSRQASYTSPSHLQDPRGSGLSLGSRSGASDDEGDQDGEKDPSASTEPMFNFRSLAEVVGVTLEGEHAGRRLSRIEADKQAKESGAKPDDVGSEGVEVEQVDDVSSPGPARETGADNQKENQSPGLAPPKVTITPETPMEGAEGAQESKQLGNETTTVERVSEVTQ
ncbi:hypothetical protein V8F06_002755 [Rhypophila decipiens]